MKVESRYEYLTMDNIIHDNSSFISSSLLLVSQKIVNEFRVSLPGYKFTINKCTELNFVDYCDSFQCEQCPYIHYDEDNYIHGTHSIKDNLFIEYFSYIESLVFIDDICMNVPVLSISHNSNLKRITIGDSCFYNTGIVQLHGRRE